MNCKEMENKISFYIDGELSEKEAKKVQDHLESCEKCQKTFQNFKSIDGLMENIPHTPAPGTTASQIIKGEGVKAQPSFTLGFRRFALAGAFIIIMLTMGLYLFKDNLFSPIPPVNPTPAITVNKTPENRELVSINYDVELNDTTYDISVKGENVQLVSLDITENDVSGINLNFDE